MKHKQVRFLLVLFVLGAGGRRELQAQDIGALSARSIRPSVVKVLVVLPYQPQPIYAAGTIIGTRNDSVYIATAEHALPDSNVGIYVVLWVNRRGTAIVARVVARDSADLAILALKRPENWHTPAVPRERSWPGAAASMVGCPRSDCTADPQPATILSSDPPHIIFRALYFEAGLSGGSLVDRDGALVGMITEYSGGTGYAVPRSSIVAFAQANGVPFNLPIRVALRHLSWYVKAMGDVTHPPGPDSDGERLWRGGRIEMGVDLGQWAELSIGYQRLAFSHQSGVWSKNDTYVGSYLTAGYRATLRNPVRSIRPSHDDYLTLGFDFMVPVEGRTWVVTYQESDSINTKYGERQILRQTVSLPSHTSTALHAQYRTPVANHVGLILGLSIYGLVIDTPQNLYSYPQPGAMVQLGLDYRGEF